MSVIESALVGALYAPASRNRLINATTSECRLSQKHAGWRGVCLRQEIGGVTMLDPEEFKILKFLGTNWWWLLSVFLIGVQLIAWLSEAAERNKGAWWVKLWDGFIKAIGWTFVGLMLLGGIIFALWGREGLTSRASIFWMLFTTGWILWMAHQHREKLQKWFGSVSLFLLLLFSVPGIYGNWQLFGFSANSLLYVMLIFVVAGLLRVLERVNAVHQDLRGLQTDFNIMFRDEVERRRNLAVPIPTSEPN